MKKNVIFLCEEKTQIKFFENMENAFNKLNYKCVYLTMDLGVFIKLKKISDNKIILCKRHKYECDTTNVLKSKEYIEKKLNLQQVEKIYRSIFFHLRSISKIDLLIASQGVLAAEIAMRDFARINRIPILFFELANIEGKTFWDIDGSNANSYLFNHIEILDKYDIKEDNYIIWREKYIKNNMISHVVKQSVNFKKYDIIFGLISRFSFIFTKLKTNKIDLLIKLKHFIKAKKLNIKYDEFDIHNNKYIFFPMQVSNDSQIILNSSIGLFEALEYAVEVANKNNIYLVVKLHPAEKNVDIIKKILKLKKIYNFKLVNSNTFHIIKNAEKIITINSTVALEAMILNKRVEVLGKSYYKFFNHERIKNYILGYLENIDYFSDEKFTEEQIKNLLKNKLNF